jgi:hypothetical protein
MGKVEMMDAMITLVGIVVLKVESELQCFIYDGMLLMLIHCLEMMCFLLIDSVGKLGDIVFLPYQRNQ